jgi:hypothetical protein
MKGGREVCVLVGRFALLSVAWRILHMGETENLATLPVLEIHCEECDGTGGEWWNNGKACYCRKCNGAGYVPTEAGKRVIALMRHNLRIDTADVSLAN